MHPSRVSDALRLYLITIERPDILAAVTESIAHGVTMVQIRFKHRTDREIVALGRQILAACRSAEVPLIVNDRIDIAFAIGADGVHLGVDDLPVKDARRLSGDHFLIGFSPETDDQIRTAAIDGASYLGIGPFFSTATKKDAGDPLGPAEFARRRRLSALPVVAIGGIDASNALQPIDAGADGIAVASAILGASDVGGATRLLRAAID